MLLFIEYPYARPGRPGAAEPCEPRQGRKAATVRRCFWVPPVPCPDIDSPSPLNDAHDRKCPGSARYCDFCSKNTICERDGYNPGMSPQRWLFFSIAILVGLGLALLYGWVLSPVEYVDTTPNTLRADFRTDFVLMTAETYQGEQNIENAARRLALLGSQPPSESAAQALKFAQQNGYASADITLLQNLTLALQAWQPPAHNTTGTPQPAGTQP
jgi:hypothetical protein